MRGDVVIKYRHDETLDEFVWDFVDADGNVIGTLNKPNLLEAFRLGVNFSKEKNSAVHSS